LKLSAPPKAPGGAPKWTVAVSSHCWGGCPAPRFARRVRSNPFLKRPEPAHNAIVNATVTLDTVTLETVTLETVTLDKAGRAVLPRHLREELRLAPRRRPGIMVRAGKIRLSPRRIVPSVERERGVWVFHLGAPLPPSEEREGLHNLSGLRTTTNVGEPRERRSHAPRRSSPIR
jgi:bifunctional DNA-binding transcriptional regulator/antitoxin component of YhaV-PrlF toxin-antitoxin module